MSCIKIEGELRSVDVMYKCSCVNTIVRGHLSGTINVSALTSISNVMLTGPWNALITQTCIIMLNESITAISGVAYRCVDTWIINRILESRRDLRFVTFSNALFTRQQTHAFLQIHLMYYVCVVLHTAEICFWHLGVYERLVFMCPPPHMTMSISTSQDINTLVAESAMSLICELFFL